jgi:hypothetical protein
MECIAQVVREISGLWASLLVESGQSGMDPLLCRKKVCYMKHLRVVLPVKILLALTASFLLWMGALFPVQAHSTLPQGTCTLAVHGVSLTITVKGANAELLCVLALHDPKIIKAAGPLGGLYETHRKPHGHLWCQRSFSGFTVTIRSIAPAIGKAACKGFMSA